MTATETPAVTPETPATTVRINLPYAICSLRYAVADRHILRYPASKGVLVECRDGKINAIATDSHAMVIASGIACPDSDAARARDWSVVVPADALKGIRAPLKKGPQRVTLQRVGGAGSGLGRWRLAGPRGDEEAFDVVNDGPFPNYRSVLTNYGDDDADIAPSIHLNPKYLVAVNRIAKAWHPEAPLATWRHRKANRAIQLDVRTSDCESLQYLVMPISIT